MEKAVYWHYMRESRALRNRVIGTTFHNAVWSVTATPVNAACLFCVLVLYVGHMRIRVWGLAMDVWRYTCFSEFLYRTDINFADERLQFASSLNRIGSFGPPNPTSLGTQKILTVTCIYAKPKAVEARVFKITMWVQTNLWSGTTCTSTTVSSLSSCRFGKNWWRLTVMRTPFGFWYALALSYFSLTFWKGLNAHLVALPKRLHWRPGLNDRRNNGQPSRSNWRYVKTGRSQRWLNLDCQTSPLRILARWPSHLYGLPKWKCGLPTITSSLT